MADDNWQQIRKIFDEALQLPPGKRLEYAPAACCGDSLLFREIQAFLASHDHAESFLETPVIDKIAADTPDPANGVKSGGRISHYEVIEQIGEGGTGAGLAFRS